MPGRKTPLVNQEIYHIFNRGVNKQDIFTQPRDYLRFQRTFFYYQFAGPKPKFSNFSKYKINSFKPISEKKLVNILCYCIMPNHFHLLVNQSIEGGISKFLSQISNSYTKYFNTKYGRIGPLLQGKFEAVRIETDEQLLHVSRYIHLNPIVSGLVKQLDNYPWSSLPEYLVSEIICSPSEVLGFFKSKADYRKFVTDQVDYGKSLELLKHHNFDNL